MNIFDFAWERKRSFVGMTAACEQPTEFVITEQQRHYLLKNPSTAVYVIGDGLLLFGVPCVSIDPRVIYGNRSTIDLRDVEINE